MPDLRKEENIGKFSLEAEPWLFHVVSRRFAIFKLKALQGFQ